ncbi:hypothetical protein GCM10022206_16140 [Streptomyces chiangmaiensis]
MANVLACMSLQATYQDKPADALAYVSAAQDEAHTTPGTTPRVRSMLAMREAFAQATLGNRTATHAAITEAHHQFERIQPSDAECLGRRLLEQSGIHTRLGVPVGLARTAA